MIQKIIHISDLHIRTFQYHDLYKCQFEIFLDDVREKTKDCRFEEIRILVVGDIFHQKINISNEQMLLTSWFLSELSNIGKVIIIPGNHDFLENNQSRVDSITPVVEMLNSEHITYYKDSGVYDDENIKWVVYSLYNKNQRPDFKKENGYLYSGLFHGPVQGLTTELGFEFADGYSPYNFTDLDIVFCGDIHKRSVFKTPNGYGYMPSSLIQQNFGESVTQHGYGVYDVIKKSYNFYDLPNKQPFLHFSISDIKDIEHNGENLLNAE